MGIITQITLKEIQELFPSYRLLRLTPTSDGVMDTTYIVSNETKSYVLKRYEREIPEKILFDSRLLGRLSEAGLNVPLHLASNRGWHLYKKLDGESPSSITSVRIISLARFMAKLHQVTKNVKSQTDFIAEHEIKNTLKDIKKSHYVYYKKLSFIKNYKTKNDGLIHGDIFQDNCVFEGSKIGVFDFIDAGYGEFLFDVAVALMAFNPSRRSLFFNLFINAYNQKAPKKISKKELRKTLDVAAAFYALLRIEKYKNTKKARELLR